MTTEYLPPARAERPGRREHLLAGRARVRHHLQVDPRAELRPGGVPHAGRVRLLRLPRPDARSFLGALLLTIVFSVVLAMIIERLILRPMIGEPIISIIMVTIGLSLVLRSVGVGGLGDGHPRLRAEALSAGHADGAGVPVSLEFVWCFVLSVFLLAVFSVFFKYSKAGVAMRATAFNQQAAQSMGISVNTSSPFRGSSPRWSRGSAGCSSETSTGSTTPCTISG